MSVLSDRSLRVLCGAGNLVRRPDGPLAYQPCSIDVHLASVAAHTGEVIAGGEGWREVTPGEGAFLLGETEEVFTLPDNVVGLVVGKSGVARAGTMVECAGLIDPGFEGTITLELANLLPMTGLGLRRGMRIAQVMFMWLDEPAELLYGSLGLGSHYQGQRGPTPSHLL